MIKWVENLGIPGLVAVADVATSEKKPTWNRPVGIGLAVAGYLLGGVLGIGERGEKTGPLTKLAIAAAPWGFESIYLYIKEARAEEEGASARLTRSRQTAANPGSRVRINPRSQVIGANPGASVAGIGAYVEEQEILT